MLFHALSLLEEKAAYFIFIFIIINIINIIIIIHRTVFISTNFKMSTKTQITSVPLKSVDWLDTALNV